MLPFIRPTARCEPITCSSTVSFLKFVPTSSPSSSSCLIAPDGDRGAKRFECAGQPLGSGTERQRMAARRQLQRSSFDDGNAVFAVVVAVTGAHVGLVAGPCRADVRERAARVRIRDGAERRIEIIRPSSAAADIHGELSVAQLHVSGAAGFLSGGAHVERDFAGRALDGPCRESRS